MAKKYLDDNGLLYFWQKIKNAFVPTSRTVNGHALSSDVTVTASDIGVESGAEVNVQADWNVTDTSSDAYIKNKPTIPAGSVVDSALSTTSENAVQNKVITNALGGKAVGNGRIFYGTCSTAASTAEKAVSCSDYDALTSGDVVIVNFTNANTASNPTLKVNGKTAKSIKQVYGGTTANLNNNSSVRGTSVFVYDGTYWIIQGVDTNTTYSDFVGANWNTAGSAGLVPAPNPIGQNADPKALFADGTWKDILTSVYPTDGQGNDLDDVLSLLITNNSIPSSQKGQANGVCPLNSSSKIESTYLPSYVDDVIEAYARSGQTELSSTWLATGSASGTVITPETGKIYVLMNDSTSYAANSQFRWSGSAYVKLADGGVSEITNAEIDTIVAS